MHVSRCDRTGWLGSSRRRAPSAREQARPRWGLATLDPSHPTLSLVLWIAFSCSVIRADDWRQFRGNDSSGVSTESNLPTKLDDPKSLAWKVPLPGRGLSGPIVVGDRVFLTASSGYRDDTLQILCFSCATGEKLWQRKLNATGRTVCNEFMCMATPQPCSDGERIYAYYSCNDVVCYDLDGNLVWYRGLGLDYPNVSSSLGMSSSPLVVDGTLVLQLDTDADSFVAGLNALTGETRWKLEQRKSAIWASPVLFRPTPDAKPQVILHAKNALLSLDPATGKENWQIEQSGAKVASTTVAGYALLAPLGQLTALRPLGASGTPERLWSEARLSPENATPVAYKDRVYVFKGSVLTCADLATGKTDWQLRLKCQGAYSSPVVGNGHIYLADENGIVQTIRLGGKKGEVASRIDLQERILCTPALAGGAFYVRSDQHLWKFAVAEPSNASP